MGKEYSSSSHRPRSICRQRALQKGGRAFGPGSNCCRHVGQVNRGMADQRNDVSSAIRTRDMNRGVRFAELAAYNEPEQLGTIVLRLVLHSFALAPPELLFSAPLDLAESPEDLEPDFPDSDLESDLGSAAFLSASAAFW